MKKVFVSENQIEAHIMKDALRRESIPVEIRGEGLSGAMGELPKFSISPTLWVPEEHYENALRVINEIQSSHQNENFNVWICAKCGEENEGQFSACWNCQMPDQNET